MDVSFLGDEIAVRFGFGQGWSREPK